MELKNKSVWLVILLIISCEQINCLKVLTVLSTHAKSHWFIGSSIAKTLAEKRHNVTVISPFPIKDPPKNYRDIVVDGLVEYVDEVIKGDLFSITALPNPVLMFILNKFGQDICEFILSNPNVTKFLNDPNEQFDVVIVELFGTSTLLALGQHFNAPTIAFSTSGSTKWTNIATGNTAPLSYVPSIYADSTGRMTFQQRLYNAFLIILDNFFTFAMNASQLKTYKKFFPNSNISYSETIKNSASLVLLNTHFSINPLAPYLPNTIEIGGIHVGREIKPLPKDLESFIETAEHGVIYFSLGSNIPSSQIGHVFQQAFAKAFAQLKEKVIWKFATSDIENLPSNVLIKSWCPQNDILAHPNVKLFISHGGLLSLIETVFHGKPIIGIPYYGDQKVNAAFAKETGFGYRLNPKDITFDSVTKALNDVLFNASYSENAKRISSIFHDQPMTPQQKLVYWVEYVTRHKGAPHLKSAGQELNFIEYHMIDVFGFIFAIVLSVFLVIFICLRLIFRKLFVKKTKVE